MAGEEKMDWPTDDRAQRPEHSAMFCIVKPGDMHFHGSMASHCGQWVPRYTCPTCGRQMRMPSNYLGNGNLACTGNRFWKPYQQNANDMGREQLLNLVKHTERKAHRP